MKKSKIKTFFFLTFLLVPASILHAVPAIPDPVVMTQPGGDALTVMIKGDERVNWYESMDGYTLLFNKSGYLSYAQLNENGNLQPSDFIATDIDKRDAEIISFLSTIEKNLYYSDVQLQLMLKVWDMEDEWRREKASKRNGGVYGEYKGICALVQFPEKAMKISVDEFDALFNELGYIGNGTGSVRDYFKEVSYELLDLSVTVVGIFTAPNSSKYYAGNSGTDNCQELATWLAREVAKKVDFRDFDANNDGRVDAFHFIYAGRGQADGGGKETIWPHKSRLQSAVVQNGKRIEEYSCSNELSSDQGAVTTIGVICHEMTHGLGADDFYDTNYATGGSYAGTGMWDLMASGNYNGQGNSPAHPNMYIKIQFGWVEPITLGYKTTITDMPNSAENPVAYIVNTATYNEYFLLENRQKVKFDSRVPGEGLLIYRVHSDVGNYCINCTHPQRLYPVCARATVPIPTSTSSSYGPINSALCTFPLAEMSGVPAKTSFTDYTTPSMQSWSQKNSNKSISNIKHEERLISFDFMHEVDIIEIGEINNALKIIPNPANEYIDVHFSITDLQHGSIDFYNLAGQLVKSVAYNAECKEEVVIQRISITDLSKGIYLIKAGSETVKLVVQ